jgi:hypothetical protein
MMSSIAIATPGIATIPVNPLEFQRLADSTQESALFCRSGNIKRLLNSHRCLGRGQQCLSVAIKRSLLADNPEIDFSGVFLLKDFPTCRKEMGYFGFTPLRRWRSILRHHKYYDFKDRVNLDIAELAASFVKFSSGEADIDVISEVVFLRPRLFPLLPDLIKWSRGKSFNSNRLKWISKIRLNEEKKSKLEKRLIRITKQALIAQLENVLENFPYPSALYPYQDNLANYKNLIDTHALQAELQRVGVNIIVKDLNDEARSEFGLESKIQAFFNSARKAIWLDYESTFYDNMFNLYQQLWHLMWSSAIEKKNINYLAYIAISKDNYLDFEAIIMNHLHAQEIGATFQRAALYHAVGDQVSFWSELLDRKLVYSQDYHDKFFYIYHRKFQYLNRWRQAGRQLTAGKNNNRIGFLGTILDHVNIYARRSYKHSLEFFADFSLNAYFWKNVSEQFTREIARQIPVYYVYSFNSSDPTSKVHIPHKFERPSHQYIDCNDYRNFVMEFVSRHRVGMPLDFRPQLYCRNTDPLITESDLGLYFVRTDGSRFPIHTYLPVIKL